MRQTIRLTESELKEMIEMSINEAIVDEFSLTGAANTVGGWFKNKMGQVGQNLKNGVSDRAQQVGNYVNDKAQQVGNYVNDKAQQVGNYVNDKTQQLKKGYGELKKTAQVGSNNQEAQKAITNAVNALKNLKQIDQKMENLGGSVIGNGPQRQAIENCIKALSGGETSISSRFQSRRDARTNPNKKFAYESRRRRY